MLFLFFFSTLVFLSFTEMECLKVDPFFVVVSEMQEIMRDLIEDSTATFLPPSADNLCASCFHATISDNPFLQETPDDHNIFYFAPLNFGRFEDCKVEDIVDFTELDKALGYVQTKRVRSKKTPVSEEIRATAKYKMLRAKNTASAKRYRWQRKLEKLEKIGAELRLEVMSLAEERDLLLSAVRRRKAWSIV